VLVLVHRANHQHWPAPVRNQLLHLARVLADAQQCSQAQRALMNGEEMFRSLVMDAPIGIALEDLEGNIQYVNPALAAMFGYSADELVGMNCSQFADAEKGSEDEGARFDAMLAGLTRGYQLEKCYNRKDRNRFWGRVNVSLLNSSGGTRVILATVEDLSEVKRASDALRNANEELGKLTSRLLQTQEEERIKIARELHDDIGQRLSLVIMEMDLLRLRQPLDESVESKVHDLLGELNELMSDIHNMSHQLHSAKLQHLGLSAAMQELCRQNATKHHIEIALSAEQIPRGLPEEIALCFYRVAQEALSNAIKHSHATRIEVTLACRGHFLMMRVEDCGVGFSPPRRGNGLGLVTMEERMRTIGGTLTIESHLGSGCCVVAEADIPQSQLMLAEEPSQDLSYDTQSLRVE
jgi:PAS domain S-box-containing protein